ncbi:MAG TPA: FtsX-like permease family protein, partial [Blastocatellia bacterium]|nr:FtsX-like permease family protein [Blastocatellia bacterium]
VFRATVSDGYFATLRTPMLAGRDFNASDTASGPKVAIVNEEFAKDVAGGANPVGKRFWIEATPDTPAMLYEIVGLVKNTKYISLDEDFSSIVFEPQSQDLKPSKTDQMLIRSSANPTEVIPSVKDAVAQIAPNAILDFSVLRENIVNFLLIQRLLAMLSGFFGVLALLLACIGLYGIVSYGVASRTGEIGIRLALGSSRLGVIGMILRETSLILVIGLALGLGLAFASGLLIRSMLFGLKAWDPLILIAATAALVTTGFVAALIPARRAGGVDPMTALRYE